MKMVSLGEVASVNPRQTKPEDDQQISFVGMAQLDAERATAVALENVTFSDRKSGYTLFQDGDILAAKITPCWENGKVGQATLDHPIGVGSTEFHVIRPTAKIDPRYLLHFLRQTHIRATGTLRMSGSGGQRRVPPQFLSALEIPLPPLDEQRRIAAILDKADAIRQKRRQAIAHLDTLTQSIFHEMFLREPHRQQKHLSDVCALQSGSTPSKRKKDYWGGDIPWFSLKDLKSNDLEDSIDHVAESALRETSLRVLPEGTVVVGVRGMILSHTLPIAKLSVAGTINQDVKALIPTLIIDPNFLLSAMEANHAYLLSKVSTAAHGTKRLESEALLSAAIPTATIEEQEEFGYRVQTIKMARSKAVIQREAADKLFASLQSRAFRGEL